MIEKKLPDGRIARFPDGTHDLIIQKTLDKLTQADEKSKKQENEKKESKAEKERKEQTDELRHKEKIAVGLQGVKSNSERNKSLADHVKATKEIGPTISKTLEGNAGRIATELAAIRKSLDGLGGTGKQLKELSECIDELGEKIEAGIQLAVKTMSKTKTVVRGPRGSIMGIKHEDDE